MQFNKIKAFSLKKSFCELRANIAKRDQNDCATVVNKKLDQICKKYANELVLLDQALGAQQQARLNLMIVEKVQTASYFYVRAGDALYSYHEDLLRSIKVLNRFKNGRFLSDQQVLNSNAEVAKALNRLNQIQAKLLQIDELIRHDTRFVEKAKNLKFWTVAYYVACLTAFVGIALVCLFSTLVDLPVAMICLPTIICCGVAGIIVLNQRVKELNVLINQEEPAYV